MKSFRHTFSYVAASGVILLAVCFFQSCQSNKPEEIKALTNLEELPSLTITDLETTVHDSGIVKYKFITPEFKKFDKKEQPYIDFPQGLQVFIYKRSGATDAHIKAKWAKYLLNEKLWELKNDVVAINQKGDILNTEQLFWDEKKALIYNNLYTKITTKTEILIGIGFESNQDLTEYSFRKPTGEFELETQP